jgi:peptide subunit release factor RF-3
MGYDFQGIYNIWEKNINLFEGDSRKNIEETIAFNDINSPELEGIIGEKPANRLREELERIAADKLNKAICFWFGECTRIEEIKRMKWHDELLPDELKKRKINRLLN